MEGAAGTCAAALDAGGAASAGAGFGKVPAEFDAAEKKIRYRMTEALRGNECQVFVTFKREAETKPDLVSWRFSIDLVAHYLPEEPEKLEKATVVEEPVVTESGTEPSPEEPATTPTLPPAPVRNPERR